MDLENNKLLKQVRDGVFQFVDLGCGTGESILYCEKKFSVGPGVGFDISQRKIDGARANNNPVALADVTKLDFPENCVSFTSMMDFLEHLYTLSDAIKILEAVGKLSKDFLFIRHPSFEDTEYLAEYGLRVNWSKWTGHRNMMEIQDFHRVFSNFGWKDYIVIPQKQIISSHHPAIVPLEAPVDTVVYDEKLHREKPRIYFSRPVYTQFDIFVRLNPEMPDSSWQAAVETSLAEERLARLHKIYEHAREKRLDAEAAYGNLQEKCAALETAYQRGKEKIAELETAYSTCKDKRYDAESAYRQIKTKYAELLGNS